MQKHRCVKHHKFQSKWSWTTHHIIWTSKKSNTIDTYAIPFHSITIRQLSDDNSPRETSKWVHKREKMEATLRERERICVIINFSQKMHHIEAHTLDHIANCTFNFKIASKDKHPTWSNDCTIRFTLMCARMWTIKFMRLSERENITSSKLFIRNHSVSWWR